jgi:hypothetical protein
MSIVAGVVLLVAWSEVADGQAQAARGRTFLVKAETTRSAAWSGTMLIVTRRDILVPRSDDVMKGVGGLCG